MRKIARRLGLNRASVALALALAMLLVPQVAVADTLYENHNETSNATYSLHGDNWAKQSATIGTAHTITGVSVRIYRTGSPGTMTLGIVDQVGDERATGTINATNCTTDSNGDWYRVNVTPEYSYANNYEIVVRAVAGDGSNYVDWLYNTEGTYSGGQFYNSTTGGASYTAVNGGAADAFFKTYGNSTLEVEQVSIFSSVMEPGDWLIVFLYRNVYPPEYQYADPEQTFRFEFWLDGNITAGRPMPAWGLKPAYIYLSADEAPEGSWGSTNNTYLSINGTDQAYDSPPSYSYDLTWDDWEGTAPWGVEDWVISSAGTVEDYYSTTLTTDTRGGQDLPYTMLNTRGCDIYREAGDNLDEVASDVFIVSKWSPEYTEPDFEDTHGETTWTDMLSTAGSSGQVPSAYATVGSIFSLSAKQVGWTIMILFTALIMGIAIYATQNPVVGLAVALPVVAYGGIVRLIPLAAIMVLAAVAVFMLLWLVWLRST